MKIISTSNTRAYLYLFTSCLNTYISIGLFPSSFSSKVIPILSSFSLFHLLFFKRSLWVCKWNWNSSQEFRKQRKGGRKVKWRHSLATQGDLRNWVLLPAVKNSWETVKRSMFYKLQERNQYKSQCEKSTHFFFSLSYLSKVNNNIIWKTVCCMNSAWKDWIFHSIKPNCVVAACSWISTCAWKRCAGRRIQNQVLSFLEDDGLWIRCLKSVTMDMNIFCSVVGAMT